MDFVLRFSNPRQSMVLSKERKEGEYTEIKTGDFEILEKRDFKVDGFHLS